MAAKISWFWGKPKGHSSFWKRPSENPAWWSIVTSACKSIHKLGVLEACLPHESSVSVNYFKGHVWTTILSKPVSYWMYHCCQPWPLTCSNYTIITEHLNILTLSSAADWALMSMVTISVYSLCTTSCRAIFPIEVYRLPLMSQYDWLLPSLQ